MAISRDDGSGLFTRQYNLIAFSLSRLIGLFYREISVWGLDKFPSTGPIMLVVAPHSHEIIDVVLVVSLLYTRLNIPVSFLVSERSMRRRFVKLIAAGLGSITVQRLWDTSRLGSGKIFAPDLQNDPRLLKGKDTCFDQEAEVGGWILVVLGGRQTLRAKVAEIRGPRELYLETPFLEEGDFDTECRLKAALTETAYYLAPKRQGSSLPGVMDSVVAKLKAGATISLFPEGHSHDQPDLLPLKTGFAITALSYLSTNHDPNFRIVPCGLHQVNGHKFRSRVGVEFGDAIRVPPALVERYKNGDKKEAAEQLKDFVNRNLKDVTWTDSNASILETTQTLRRLYRGQSGLYSLNQRTLLNKRILEALSSKREDAKVRSLLSRADQYNLQLHIYGLRHHDIKYATFSRKHVMALLIFQVCKLLPAFFATIPGLVLFAPVLIFSHMVSGDKVRGALKTHPFKVKGVNISAAWKMLAALAFAPCLYSSYVALIAYWAYQSRCCSTLPSYIPHLIPFLGFILLPAITILSLHTGEFAVDTLKSLPPLLMLLRPSSASVMKDLFEKQRKLTCEVKEFIDSSTFSDIGK